MNYDKNEETTETRDSNLFISNIKEINQLPDDIINYIFEFIPKHKLIKLNKTYYNLYHYMIRNFIPTFDSYVRSVVRCDMYLVFDKILSENFISWIKHKKRNYLYRNMVFNNYIYFLLHYCIENKSERCREILLFYFKQRDLCKNLHKKKVVKYIKWTT